MTATTATRPWHDHRAWTAALADARTFAAKETLLYRWVAATGGHVEAALAFLPSLPAGPARDALVGALMKHGIASRIGAATGARPCFGRELRGRGIKPTARLTIRFAMESLADRGPERLVTGRVADGAGKFSLAVITGQPEGELLALHHQRGGLRVEGSLSPHARDGDTTVSFHGTILAGA